MIKCLFHLTWALFSVKKVSSIAVLFIMRSMPIICLQHMNLCTETRDMSRLDWSGISQRLMMT